MWGTEQEKKGMKMSKTVIEEFTQSKEGMQLFQQERVILEATEMVYNIMQEEGVTKAELAERLGRSKGYITQLLNGTANMTLRTLSDVCVALDRNINLETSPLSLSSTKPQEWTAEPTTIYDFPNHFELGLMPELKRRVS